VGGAVIVVAIGGQLQPQKQKQLKRLQAAGLKGGVGQEPPTAQLALAIPTEAEVSSRRRRLWAHLQRKSSRSALLLPLLLLLLLLLHFAEITLTSGRDRDGQSGASEMERIKHTRLANKARY